MNVNEDNRVEENYGQFDLGMKALIKSFHAVFFVLAVIIIGMFVFLFVINGFKVVKAQETMLVYRFGKFVGEYSEEWTWVFPYPVDEFVLVPTNKQKISTFAFWPNEEAQAFKDVPDQRPGGPLVPGKDGYLLTGDANILHAKWEMVYNITNPKRYYEQCICRDPKAEDEIFANEESGEIMGSRGPKTLLKNVLDDVIIKITATEKVEDALYVSSVKYMHDVETAVAAKVADMDIGVKVESVMLTGKSPPLSTVQAFADVYNAEMESNTTQQKAREYAVELGNKTDSEKERILADAEAYKRRVVAEIQSEKAYFEKILDQYQRNSHIVLVTLYNDTVSKIISDVKNKFIIRNDPNSKQEVRLKINREPEDRSRKEKRNEKKP